MRLRRIQFTTRVIMIVVAIAAIWMFIITEAMTYQARHLGIH